MSYLEKYLKYKTKYFELKYQLGGKLNCGEMSIIFELIDNDNSGKISLNEFTKFFMAANPKAKKNTLSDLITYFKSILDDLFLFVEKLDDSPDKDTISLVNSDKFFDKIDISKDGSISNKEFTVAAKMAGIKSSRSIDRLIDLFTTSKNKTISKVEFNNILSTLFKGATTPDSTTVSREQFHRKITSIATDVFSVLDTDKSASFDESELKKVFKQFSGKDLKLDKAEFNIMMKSVSSCETYGK